MIRDRSHYGARMRAGRLVAILRLLQSRGRMTAGQIAAELEVSSRTVVRDIEALSGAGFPLYVMRGRGGGVELLGEVWTDHGRIDGLSPLPPTATHRVRVSLSPQGRRLAVVFGHPPAVRVRTTQRSPHRRPGWIEATMTWGALDDAVRDLLGLGAEVEVVGPVEVRTQVADVAHRVADLYAQC